MMRDPGLLTDSTGEGMAGAEDVSYATQQELKKTMYNGSKNCKSCGSLIDPVQAMHLKVECNTCTRRKQSKLVKGRMA